MDESQAPASTAAPEQPTAPVSEQPTKAPTFPGVAIGERAPVAPEPAPAAKAAQEPSQQTEPEDLPDDLLEKFEKHPKFQSRVDKTVRKAIETERQTWQATQAEQAAQAARLQAEADMEAMLEQVANGTWNEEAQQTANRARLERIQNRHRADGMRGQADFITQQAELAYQEIPELKDEAALTAVRQAGAQSWKDWVTTLAATVRAQTTAELTAKWEKDKAKLAEALKEDVRGEVRSSMRVPDLGSSSTAARATQGFQYLEDAEAALMEGRISTGRLRALSQTLTRRPRAA